MSGESYGVSPLSSCLFSLTTVADSRIQGRYLPIFASAVVDGNRALVAEGKKPINLQSVLIGNGVTDSCEYTTILEGSQAEINRLDTLYESYFDFVSAVRFDASRIHY